jgi:fructose-1,6-bisphosphatase/inositol monophosphatase family enzyme
VETDEVLALLRDVADEVVNPRFRSLGKDDVAEKNPGDLVTVADREAEVLITAALLAAYPDAVILGEEATSADATVLDRFAAAEHAFTVDPVDGTKNFVSGSPDHAMMVAEIRGGTVVRSWIWQPQHELD